MNTQDNEDQHKDKDIKLLNKKRNVSPSKIENKINKSSPQRNVIKKQIIYESIDYKVLIDEAFDYFLQGQNDKFLVVQDKLEKHKKTKANNIIV